MKTRKVSPADRKLMCKWLDGVCYLAKYSDTDKNKTIKRLIKKAIMGEKI